MKRLIAFVVFLAGAGAVLQPLKADERVVVVHHRRHYHHRRHHTVVVVNH